MRNTAGRRAQKGQAMILGLLVMVMSGGMLYFLFNSGQILREKTTATNAADAAAISGATVMARVMNFEAYTNRAVMAHVIGMGQLTALASWDQNAIVLGVNEANQSPDSASIAMFCLTAQGLTPLPCTYGGNPILQYFTGESVFRRYTQDLHPVIRTLSETESLRHNTGIKGLQAWAPNSQGLPLVKEALLGAMPVARQLAINNAVDRNYQDFGPATGRSVLVEDTFFSFGGVAQPMIRRMRNGDRERMRATVEVAANRDAFVKERQFTRQTLLPTCAGLNGIKWDDLKRGGGTRIGLDEWEAIDTSSWHQNYMRKGRCRVREIPLGYGEAEAGGGDGLSTNNMGGSGMNPQAANNASAQSTTLTYGGLPNFFELSDAALSTARPLARFAVRVNRRQGDFRVPNRAATARAGGGFDLMGAPGARTLAALSTAEVYFDRLSPRADGREELASLFNPFWHVRLGTPGLGAIAETAATQ